jgi:exodeoxyribonuclease X
MSVIRVFDVETTGISPTDHRVIEIAAYDLHPDNRVVRVGSHLVNPGRTIPPEASAIHHLIDADLAGSQPLETVWANYSSAGAPVYFAAHNCDFERGYLPTPQGTQWICTHKCAMRAWSHAPAHSNQVLRYWIGLDGHSGFDRKIAAQAHRAEADAYVTAWLLMTLRSTVPLDTLVLWTSEPRCYPRIAFGKHRGKIWSEIPADYLQWMCSQQDMELDWRHCATIELQKRSSQPTV